MKSKTLMLQGEEMLDEEEMLEEEDIEAEKPGLASSRKVEFGV